MNKKYFALKLIPNRSDFAQTMTAAERNIMQHHVAYWKEFMAKGMIVAFGPVIDPAGTYGLGIVSVDNEVEVNKLITDDPASTINKYEYYPMLAIVPEK